MWHYVINVVIQFQTHWSEIYIHWKQKKKIKISLENKDVFVTNIMWVTSLPTAGGLELYDL